MSIYNNENLLDTKIIYTGLFILKFFFIIIYYYNKVFISENVSIIIKNLKEIFLKCYLWVAMPILLILNLAHKIYFVP